MTDWTGTLPTLPALHAATASELAVFLAAVAALTDPKGAYVPVLTSSGTNPTGQTVTGFYSRANKQVNGRALITFAATIGTGSYFVDSPTSTAEVSGESAGSALFFDTSAGTRYPLAVFWVGAHTVSFGIPGTGGRLTNVAPVTVAAGDQISVKWDYEGA